jgi:hypothetical protein
MNSGFGARLRAHREQRQVALATVAAQTKIKASLLDGLEREDLSHWPSGVFRRSYVRAYAAAVGLEPETVLREFQERFPDATEAVQPVSPASQRATGETINVRPPTRLRFLIGSALDALPGIKSHLQSSVGLGSARPAPARDVVEPSPMLTFDRETYLAVEPARAHTEEAPEPQTADAMLFELTPPDPSARLAFAEANDEEASVALPELAELCVRLARAADTQDLQPVLCDAARLLDAAGLTLWMWDANSGMLHPALVHGYAPEVAAQLPSVPRDSENSVAAAFRTTQTRVVDNDGTDTGAVAVPLRTSAGCAGVLAFELRHGGERRPCVRACAEILAAQLSLMVGLTPLVQAATA